MEPVTAKEVLMFFCRNCRKLIEDNDDYCTECKALMYDRMRAIEKVFTPATDTAGRMVGFGKALAGVILASQAFLWSCGALIFGAFATDDSVLGVSLAFWLVGLPFGIVAVVLGVKSIKHAARTRKGANKKSIPALPLGIVGTALGSFGLSLELIAALVLQQSATL